METSGEPEGDEYPLARFVGASVASVHQAGEALVMEPAIQARVPGTRVAGRAVTCLCAYSDNLALHRLIRVCGPGDLLIAVAAGNAAVLGELMALQARQNGATGAVIDGRVRDLIELRSLPFPVWSRAISPAGPDHIHPGEISVPVVCGGVLVYPGDLVVADDDGVAVLRKDGAEAALERIELRERNEEELRRSVRAGKSLFTLLGLDETRAPNSSVGKPNQ